MTKDEALKMAIEALELLDKNLHIGMSKSIQKLQGKATWEAIANCKEALEVADRPEQPLTEKSSEAEPAQMSANESLEPVAWMTKWENQDGEIKYAVYEEKIGKFDIPLYTHPHQVVPTSTWQGLTDDEIDEEALKDDHAAYFALGALWANEKLKEKNI